jgi:hypothetical protein
MQRRIYIVGGLGPTEIDEQKKVIKNFFSPHIFSSFILLSLKLKRKGNFFSWEAPSGLVGGPLLVGGLGPGPHGPP